MNATRNLTAKREILGTRGGQERRQAFSLVELLVLMGVLAILGLLALPALARTRPNSKIVQCCNNLRQWGQASQMYSGENGDNMPRDGMSATGTYAPGGNGDHADPNAWFNLLPPYLAEKTLIQYWAAPGFNANRMTCIPFPGGLGRIWHCPSASMTADQVNNHLAGSGAEGFFSYDMSIDLKKQTADSNLAYPLMPKRTALSRPAATVLFLDCAFNPQTDVVNGSPQYNSVDPASRWRSFASRHNAGGVINFIDGHAQYFTDRYVTNGATTYEPRNPDIIWNAPYRLANP
jgi:type II secretory pathway pseudopilin PulG